MDELQRSLMQKQIDMRLKFSSTERQLQGISFKMGDYSFKGSAIDRELSVKKLGQRLEMNMQMELKQQIEKQQQLLLSQQQERHIYRQRISH